MYVYSRNSQYHEKQGAQLLEPEVRTPASLHTQKPQNPLVCEGEVTPADARGHGKSGQEWKQDSSSAAVDASLKNSEHGKQL